MKYQIDCLTQEFINNGEDTYVLEDIRTYLIEMPKGKTPTKNYNIFTDLVVDAIRKDNNIGCEILKNSDMAYTLVIYVANFGFVFKRYIVKRTKVINPLRKDV